MKDWLIAIGIAVLVACSGLLIAVSASAEDWIRWQPVCRHQALYWAVTVGEQFPTRIMYGWFTDRAGIKYYHVQPQMYVGEKWWYFRVENEHVILITKPTFTIIYKNTGEKEETTWYPQFHFKSFEDYVNYLEPILIKGPK
jgi:hypothetical protein